MIILAIPESLQHAIGGGIGTLVMGLFANVPYAQAAGMGLNAFFTYTVCFGLGFSCSRPCAWCSCAA